MSGHDGRGDRRMRVAYISGGYRPRHCGVAAYTQRLIRALGDVVEPVVLTAAPADNAGNPWEVVASRSDWRLRDLVLTLAEARRRRPLLLHVQYAPVSFRWRRAVHLLPVLARAILGRVPVVVTAHEFGQWAYRPPLVPSAAWNLLAERAASRGWFDAESLTLVIGAARTITTNAQHAALIRASSPAAGRRLEVIPIGPNIDAPTGETGARRATARRRWGISENAPLVVFFGFLHPVKGLEYLVRAFARVRLRHPDTRLLLSGGWESLALPGAEGEAYRDRLLGLIGDLDLAEATRVTGYLPAAEVSDILLAADVAVLPFTYGATFKSGTLLAALAHRLPVVTTYANPPDPDLRDGEHVVCVPPRDAERLAESLLGLLGAPAQRQRLAEAGADVAERFSWSHIAARHLAVYHDVLAAS